MPTARPAGPTPAPRAPGPGRRPRSQPSSSPRASPVLLDGLGRCLRLPSLVAAEPLGLAIPDRLQPPLRLVARDGLLVLLLLLAARLLRLLLVALLLLLL